MEEDEYVIAKTGISRADELIRSVAVSVDDPSNEGIKTYNENPCIFGSASWFHLWLSSERCKLGRKMRNPDNLIHPNMTIYAYAFR